MKSLTLSFCIWLLWIGQSAFGQGDVLRLGDRWKAGDVLFDENRWVEVIVGDMPLVIAVPHGGAVKPDEVSDRGCKGVKQTDRNTIQTARAIEAAFVKKYNKRPFIVISHIARVKVDQNRDLPEATCGNPLSEKAWYSFHSRVDTALALAVEQFGDAVFIDLHGHGHPNQRLELGYALTKEDLTEAFNDQNLEALAKRSSLKNIVRKNANVNFKELLFGKDAFGSLMYKRSILVTPSIQDPHPVNEEKFFAGGFNTRKYTSEKYPMVYGWQIECNYKGIRDSESNRTRFGEAFADAFLEFQSKLN